MQTNSHGKPIQKALKTAKEASVKNYTDYKQLLKDHEKDAVIIALPTYLHAQCAEQAAENKKNTPRKANSTKQIRSKRNNHRNSKTLSKTHNELSNAIRQRNPTTKTKH